MPLAKEIFRYKVDKGIRGRLNPLVGVEFPKYSANELVEILEDRAKRALIPGAVNKNQLRIICREANGDARFAIIALRIAAQEIKDSYKNKM